MTEHLGTGNQNATTWTPEHDAALRQHRADGCSVSQAAIAINEEFSTSYTRNAAMGRMHRLGMSEPMTVKRVKIKIRETSPAPGKPRHRPGRYKPVADEDLRKARPRFTAPGSTTAEPFIPRCDEIVPRWVGLLDLLPSDCRWPYGDGKEAYLFCAHPKVEGSNYCGPHLRLSIGRGTSSERSAA